MAYLFFMFQYFKITERAVSDSTLANNTDDYIECHDNTPFRDLEHVIELYDFPPSFKTEDLMQLYRSVHQEPMHIKWCDDTHALLVLSSPVQGKCKRKLFEVFENIIYTSRFHSRYPLNMHVCALFLA